MEKMFKRSILGAAVAFAAVSGSANAAIELAGESVVMYGQAAGFVQYASPKASGADGSVGVEIESRIGFRGRVAFDEIGPDFIWQIEGGNTNNVPWANGTLGQRDTFLGFDFDGVGSIKFGRQLVAAYNYVDWPHTNPGLGNVFDNTWGPGANATGATFAGRDSNVLRFDSATFGGFNFQATLSGMGSSTDELVSSVAGSYSQSLFNVHAGIYNQSKYSETVAATEDSYEFDTKTGDKKLVPGEAASTVDKGDASYYIIGGSVYLGDFTLTAGYKEQENGLTNVDQSTYSGSVQYMVTDTVLLKAGYAHAAETTSGANDDATAITGRILKILPSSALYFDVRNYDYAGSDESSDTTNFLAGVEYYF